VRHGVLMLSPLSVQVVGGHVQTRQPAETSKDAAAGLVGDAPAPRPPAHVPVFNDVLVTSNVVVKSNEDRHRSIPPPAPVAPIRPPAAPVTQHTRLSPHSVAQGGPRIGTTASSVRAAPSSILPVATSTHSSELAQKSGAATLPRAPSAAHQRGVASVHSGALLLRDSTHTEDISTEHKLSDSPLLSAGSNGSTGFWNRIGSGSSGDDSAFLLEDETSFDYGEPVMGGRSAPQPAIPAPFPPPSIAQRAASVSGPAPAGPPAMHLHDEAQRLAVAGLTSRDLLSSTGTRAVWGVREGHPRAGYTSMMLDDAVSVDDDGLSSPPAASLVRLKRKAPAVVVIDMTDSSPESSSSSSLSRPVAREQRQDVRHHRHGADMHGRAMDEGDGGQGGGAVEKEEEEMFSQVPAPPQWRSISSSSASVAAPSTTAASKETPRSLLPSGARIKVDTALSADGGGVMAGSELRRSHGTADRCYVVDLLREAEERAQCGQDPLHTSQINYANRFVACEVVTVKLLRIRKEEYYVLVEVDDGRENNEDDVFPLVRIGPHLCEQILEMSAKEFETEKHQVSTTVYRYMMWKYF
jgi:hypothetical protein